jgi:hypothetical protein
VAGGVAVVVGEPPLADPLPLPVAMPSADVPLPVELELPEPHPLMVRLIDKNASAMNALEPFAIATPC